MVPFYLNHWFLAFYGWLFFNLLLLGFSKDRQDEKKNYFDIGIWWRYHWDNVFITLFAIPLIVIFKAELWQVIINDWAGKDWEYSNIVLMGAVPLVQLVYFLIRKIAK